MHADHAGQTLGAAAARQQADLGLGQADLDLPIFGGDTVVTGQTDLVTTTQGMAVDRGHEGLAAGFHTPKDAMQDAHELFQHGDIAIAHDGEIGSNEKFLVGRGDNHALDVLVGDGLFHTLRVGRHGLHVHDVHGAVGNIPGDGGNAVAIHIVIHHGLYPCVWSLGLALQALNNRCRTHAGADAQSGQRRALARTLQLVQHRA